MGLRFFDSTVFLRAPPAYRKISDECDLKRTALDTDRESDINAIQESYFQKLKELEQTNQEGKFRLTPEYSPGGYFVRSRNEKAYNRAEYLPERKKMMKEWADYLDKIKAGAQVIQFASTSA